MNINECFELVNFIANKEHSGNTFSPQQFNLVAKVSQTEFINKRLGNIKALQDGGSPAFGYKSTRKVDIDLRPLVYGPLSIPIDNNGNFNYPDGFLWPDAIHKQDYSPIMELDSDEYPRMKHSTFDPPTADYPILIYRNPYGFIDPYNIGNFMMSYVKTPPDPVWGFDEVSGGVVYNPAKSQDFIVNPYTNAHLEIILIMLAKLGIRLDMNTLVAYASAKEAGIS